LREIEFLECIDLIRRLIYAQRDKRERGRKEKFTCSEIRDSKMTRPFIISWTNDEETLKCIGLSTIAYKGSIYRSLYLIGVVEVEVKSVIVIHVFKA
jgi:hypothetical protein